MQEEAVRFGDHQYLLGILSRPANPAPLPAVLFLNAGLIHHIGPSRIYVRMAREIASMGFNTLRFDFSGVGDSCARADGLPVDVALIHDVRQAMDYLEDRLGISEFLLIGHCGGAWVAFVAAAEDERVIGTVLINPESTQDNWVEYDRQRKESNYYKNYYAKEALFDADRWKKVLTGKADYRSIYNNIVNTVIRNEVSTRTFRLRNRDGQTEPNTEATPWEDRLIRVAETLMSRRTRLLLTFSKGSSSFDYVHTLLGKQLQTMFASDKAEQVIIPNADHTFTLLAGQQALSEQIAAWCATFEHSIAE